MAPVSISPDADPYRAYRTVGFALIGCVLGASCAEFIWNYVEPSSRDFVSFWGAAKLAIAGTPASAYDNAALHAVQLGAARFDGGEMPFAYPPAFLLFVLPFGILPFPLAMALWSTVTMIVYAKVANRLAPRSGWLAVGFPPVFAVAAIGQNGFVTAAFFLGGLTLLHRKRRFAAGLMLGCLVLKPQIALMLPVAMLAGREWRVIAGAMLSSAATLVVGLVCFGPEASRAWLGQMPLYARIARNGLVGWHKFVSVYASCRQAGLSEHAALALHAFVAVAAAALVARIWRSNAEPMAKAAIVGAATMLASPYIYVYDSLILIPAFVLLVEKGAPVALVGSLWLLPLAIIAQTMENSGPINIGALLPIALLLCYYIWGRGGNTDRSILWRSSATAPVLASPSPTTTSSAW